MLSNELLVIPSSASVFSLAASIFICGVGGVTSSYSISSANYPSPNSKPTVLHSMSMKSYNLSILSVLKNRLCILSLPVGFLNTTRIESGSSVFGSTPRRCFFSSRSLSLRSFFSCFIVCLFSATGFTSWTYCYSKLWWSYGTSTYDGCCSEYISACSFWAKRRSAS